MRLEKFLPLDPPLRPADFIIAEPNLASPLPAENVHDIVLRAALPCDRCGNENVEEAEHRGGRRVRLIRERVFSAPWVMQSRRRLELGVMLGATQQELRELPNVGKGVGCDAPR